MPISSRSLKHYFSLKAAADIRTAVADANIIKQRSSIGFAPITKERRVSVHNQPWYGKNSNFATFNELLHKSYLIGQKLTACTDLDLLWRLRFLLGDRTAVQDDALTNPNEWTHDVKFIDVGTSAEVDYTSIIEEIGGGTSPGHEVRFDGVWMDQVQLTGAFGDFIQVGFTGGARRMVASTSASLPASETTAHLLQINRTKVILDVAGGSTNIDGKWTAFDITLSQNPDVKLRSGQPTGQEELVHRVDRGDQTATGSISVELEDTLRNLYNAVASDEANFATIKIEMISKDIIDVSNPFRAIMTIPKIRFESESFSEEGRTTILTLNLADQSIIDDGVNPPILFEVFTDIADADF